jgi:hypothetical protein
MDASEHDTQVIPTAGDQLIRQLDAKRAKKAAARETTYIVLTKRAGDPDWSLMLDGDALPAQFTGTREKVIGKAFAQFRGDPEDTKGGDLQREISPVALRGWKPAIVRVESVEKVVVGR